MKCIYYGEDHGDMSNFIDKNPDLVNGNIPVYLCYHHKYGLFISKRPVVLTDIENMIINGIDIDAHAIN